MIKEFNNETQAKAIADSLGLFMTKYRGVYLVGNSKGEMLAKYNIGFHSKENVFYDKELFEADASDFLVIKDKNIVDASSIEIPYNLKKCVCMFCKCLSLEIPPIIPDRVKVCSFMFENCTSLVTPPILPNGVQECRYMFYNCTSLRKAPIVPEGVKVCSFMFENCVSLSTPTNIPESVESCRYMFSGCTSLETPPKIPESIKDCRGIFSGCESLKECPHFPEICDTYVALRGTPFDKKQ